MGNKKELKMEKKQKLLITEGAIKSEEALKRQLEEAQRQPQVEAAEQDLEVQEAFDLVQENEDLHKQVAELQESLVRPTNTVEIQRLEVENNTWQARSWHYRNK
ncbi:hypothetical protein GOP47_0022180 [Adiantum capillus-veneris]|uniref:Uncharacterized protein n=1 Tax=Adiantum capillus-veneris TaxID=13818 RepID=A0A9D4U9T5_ADICA|nr:hypothetical protein GOP47_0022180 [Adiantum capillus-veneris]